MISIRNGRMTIKDGSRTVFDSNDKLLHLAAKVDGVTPYYSYHAGNDVGLDLTDRVLLGTVPVGCTQVVGAVKMEMTTNSGAGLRFDRWHMVMGGSIIWVMDGEPGFADRLGSNLGLRQFCSYHFSVSAGGVYLNRRVVLDRIPYEYFVKSHRLHYRLRAGVWV